MREDKRRKLSRREAHRLALHHAITDRDAMVDAYSCDPTSPHAVEARFRADEFRRVLADEFGERCFEDAIHAMGKPVSIQELQSRGPQEFRADPVADEPAGADPPPPSGSGGQREGAPHGECPLCHSPLQHAPGLAIWCSNPLCLVDDGPGLYERLDVPQLHSPSCAAVISKPPFRAACNCGFPIKERSPLIQSPPPTTAGIGEPTLHTLGNEARTVIDEFLMGPCPICAGIEGCSHTVPERLRSALLSPNRPEPGWREEDIGRAARALSAYHKRIWTQNGAFWFDGEATAMVRAVILALAASPSPSTGERT